MSSVKKDAQKAGPKNSEKTATGRVTQVVVKIDVLKKPEALKRVVQTLVRENKSEFSGILATPAKESVRVKKVQVEAQAPTRAQIKRVVERNIHSVYDHPRIIAAVTEYLHKQLTK